MSEPQSKPLSEDVVAALARTLNLDPGRRSLPVVTANLALLQAMAAEFMDLPLGDHLDPVGLLRL